MPDVCSCQSQFHEQWGHLHDPHLRALAWLLHAPDLLDAQASRWQGKIANLNIDKLAVSKWLSDLAFDPAPLHTYLASAPTNRLGRYAEKLLTFYFGWCGVLMAHGLQVKQPGGATIGEFDFLLHENDSLRHIELATKFYLFEAAPGPDAAESFLGPNLADTLGAKMQKILNRQLALAKHPASQAYLPRPISGSQALVKGWLFYHGLPLPSLISTGVARDHCRGFWCSFEEFQQAAHHYPPADAFMPLPRLAWLAPARVLADAVKNHERMSDFLEAHFAVDSTPVMVAMLRYEHALEQAATQVPVLQARPDTAQTSKLGFMQEIARCFIVPNDWRDRAREKNQRSILKWEGAVKSIEIDTDA